MKLLRPEQHIANLEERKSDLKQWVLHLSRGDNWDKVADTCRELIKVESELKVWNTIKGN